MMNPGKILSTAVLFLLPGTFAPIYAQEHREQEKQPEQKQAAKPAQQQQRAEQKPQAKPAQPQQRAEQKQQAKPAQPQQRAEQKPQAKPAQQQQRAEQQQQAKPAQQQQRAEHQQQAKPAQQQQQRAAQQQQPNRGQPTGSHGRIPDDRFQASFGRGHTFHVNRGDFTGRSRRFNYGGYWFSMINPWPVEWLYTDDVYVDYMNGGYFLCDPVHPGVFLSISIG